MNEDEQLTSERIRKSGGARKLSIERLPGIDELFLKLLRDFTACDPMLEELKWTHLTYAEVSQAMAVEGINTTKSIVKKLLKRHGFVKRKTFKTVKLGVTQNGDEQFKNIAAKKEAYAKQGNPVISVDS